MKLGTEVGLCPGDFVLDVEPAPHPKKGHSPQFWLNVYCGQTAGWIKMRFGRENSGYIELGFKQELSSGVA